MLTKAAQAIRPALFASAVALAAVPQSAIAQQVYSGTFTPLNNSGVTGTATLTLSSDAHTLNVEIQAMGLEAGEPHVAHIHGLDSAPGMPVDSTTPTLAQDRITTASSSWPRARRPMARSFSLSPASMRR